MPDQTEIRQSTGAWVIRAGGAVIAETRNAIELIENGGAPVIYFPRDDIAMAFLDPSETEPRPARQGEARFYSMAGKSGVIADAAWSYETPKPGFEAIAGHLAFDRAKVTLEQL